MPAGFDFEGFSDQDELEKNNTVMKTAMIRVSKVNHTGKNKDVIVEYSLEQIKGLLDGWAKTTRLDYFLKEHIPDDDVPNDHFHFVVRLYSPTKFSVIKNKFPFGNIQRAKSIKNCVRYLVHADHPEKLQYEWTDILTNADLTPFKVRSRSQNDINLQRVFESIDNGVITPFNYTDLIGIDLFAKNKTAIKNALEFAIDRIISDPDRPLTVMYFYGRTGIGKTSFAKKFCKESYPDENPCITSSGNDPLQDYKGQKTLIWDDFRDSQFKFSDLLKFIDPFTRSSGKSRYNNKHFLGNLIIITSTQRLDFIYKGCENNSEDMKQLRRRISYYYEFVEDKIRIYVYAGNNHYKFFKEHINPYYGMEEKPLSEINFDYSVYEKMGIKLEDPISRSSAYINCEMPATNEPIFGCEIIQMNGRRSAHR